MSHWTVSRRVVALAALFVAATGGIVLFTLGAISTQQSVAVVVDLAGRQRMLHERHLRQVVLASEGVQADIVGTRRVLEGSLRALLDGGPAIAVLGQRAVVQLPPAPTPAIRRKLQDQRQLLEEVSQRADAFLRLARDDPHRSADLQALLRLNDYLQATANEAVKLLDRYAEDKITGMIRLAVVVALLVAGLGLIVTYQVVRSQRALEAEVGERHRAETALRRSEARAVEALRQSEAIKSALLSSVSHELRTPLTAIKSMVAGLSEDEGGPTLETRKEFLAGIQQEVDYLTRLVNNLLGMSRIEAGTLTPRREVHLLEDLVEGAIRRLGAALQGRPFTVALDEALPALAVDGMEIQLVLVNLLDNAIKYSPAGSPIRLGVRLVGEAVEVRVSNAGDGIPAADLMRVFERFYRGSSATRRGVPGTGLGLAICKGIVESHEGRIWAESVSGRETTLVFTLRARAERVGALPQDGVGEVRGAA